MRSTTTNGILYKSFKFTEANFGILNGQQHMHFCEIDKPAKLIYVMIVAEMNE